MINTQNSPFGIVTVCFYGGYYFVIHLDLITGWMISKTLHQVNDAKTLYQKPINKIIGNKSFQIASHDGTASAIRLSDHYFNNYQDIIEVKKVSYDREATKAIQAIVQWGDSMPQFKTAKIRSPLTHNYCHHVGFVMLYTAKLALEHPELKPLIQKYQQQRVAC